MRRFLIVLMSLAPITSLIGGPPYGDPLTAFRNDLHSLEVDFQQMKERLANQDAAIESLQDDISSCKNKENREAMMQMEALDTELQTIKTYLNQLADEIETNRKKNLELGTQLSTIQGALGHVMEALGIDTPSSGTYVVKPGDSLGGIAQKNKTTIGALKKANPQLKGDKIIVGQKLNLP